MKEVTPKVFLIGETVLCMPGFLGAMEELGAPDWRPTRRTVSHAEQLTEFAGKLCYMSFATDLNANLTRANARDQHTYIQEGIIAHKHGSVLEHSTVNLLFSHVSRVITHEIVRHRQGTAFSQVSGRYVRSSDFGYWVPTVIRDDAEAHDAFQRVVEETEDRTRELEQRLFDSPSLTFRVKKIITSALRRLIGFGKSSHILVTANHRALRHMIQVRTHESAEEEIRLVFGQVAEMMAARYGAIYADMKREFIDGHYQYTFDHEKV